ncbi:YncE family protein [Govanella unica]|uniref:YncE family protein n=1 Tax=Govanella unica TaxID=2975056 RepID=A0A9X3TYF7_9PROT|nr:hypothetical protein [Govania unica]MDA5193992.1 hypothetical protein [Govania unica]
MKFKSIILAAASCLMAAGPLSAETLLYRVERTVMLPSSNTGWDYIKFQPGTNRLFMARADDGLTLYDVDSQSAVATIENSKDANGPLLLPDYNRGYIAMTDGSLLSIDLQTLKPIARVKLDANGGLNSAVYDPATKRVHAITSTRAKEATWYTLDAKTGQQIGKTVFPFRKMDDPAHDGKGRLFAPARYDQIILTLDSKTLAEKARWTVGCNVSKVRYQAATNRILAACGGDKAAFLALDADSGRELARIPIGKGIDGFSIDEQRHRIVTSNGSDGTLTVIQQNSADDYQLLGTVATRVGARMSAMDERSGKLYLVNADFTQPPAGADGKMPDEVYHPDSFVVMTYSPD